MIFGKIKGWGSQDLLIELLMLDSLDDRDLQADLLQSPLGLHLDAGDCEETFVGDVFGQGTEKASIHSVSVSAARSWNWLRICVELVEASVNCTLLLQIWP